jgi:signal transduction histidine kinase
MLTTVGVVVLALGVTYLVVLPLVESMMRQQHVDEAQRIAQLISEECARSISADSSVKSLEEEIRRWRNAVAPQCIAIANASGDIRRVDREVITQCASRELVGAALQSENGAAWGDASDQHLVVAVALRAEQVEYGPGEGARLVVATSVEDIESRLSVLRTLILLFMGLAVGLVTLLGYITLTQLVVRPIQRVVGALEGNRYGGVGTAEPTGGRELQELATSVNRLGRRLEDDENRISLQIGELKLVNQELESMRDNLVRTEKLASVGRLAAGVAHEIGNPIGIVLGYLEMLQHPSTTEEQRSKYIARSLEATQRIGVILRDLLEFARPDSDTIDQTTDVIKAVESVSNLLRPQNRLRHVALDIQLPKDSSKPIAQMAQRRFEQILINLILNAADATAELATGQASVRIVIPEPIAEWITLHIYDNGCGIRDDIKSQIFDPFFSTKEPGSGTGLGLSVCYSLVTGAGGDLVVDSVVGQGTCFTMTIPGG